MELGLDLPLAAARPAPAADPRSAPLPSPEGDPVGPKAAATAGPATSEDLSSFGDWEQADLDVDLDMGSMPPPAHLPPTSAAPAAEAPSLGIPLDDDSPPRTQVPAQAPQGPMALAPITEAEVEAVAQFGPKPANVFMAPRYAWKVFRRKPELEKLYALRLQTHEAGVRGLRRQRKEIFEAVSRRHPTSVQALQSGLDAADAMVMQQQSQFSQQNQVVAQQLEGLEGRRRGLEEQLGQRRRDHQLAQVAVEEARRRHKQLETDIERLVDRMARAQQGSAPGVQTSHVDVGALEQQKQALVAQISARKQAIFKAQQVAQQRRQELQALERDIEGIDQQVGQAERTAQMTQASTFRALNAAQDARLDAYDDALRNVMEQAPDLLEAPEKVRLSELEEGIADLGKQLEVHRRAMTAYDETARRQGIGIAVVVAVAVLLVLASLVRVG